jgi:hypothetical protein
VILVFGPSGIVVAIDWIPVPVRTWSIVVLLEEWSRRVVPREPTSQRSGPSGPVGVAVFKRGWIVESHRRAPVTGCKHSTIQPQFMVYHLRDEKMICTKFGNFQLRRF